MGTDKARLEVDGAPMARRVADALRVGGATSVVLVGGHPDLAAITGLAVQPDRWPGEGPLAGTASALLGVGEHDPGAVVVVAACDQPDLAPGLVRRLVDALAAAGTATGVAVPRTADGRRQPFPAAWRATAAPIVSGLVAQGARRADAAHDAVGVVEVPAQASELADLDAPEDLARRRMGDP